MKTTAQNKEPPRLLQRDEDLIVVFKPAGLDTFPGRKIEGNSLLFWLIDKEPTLEKVGDIRCPAIVHRLDRFTSGLMLVATNDATYKAMRDAFREGLVVKEYIALVEGVIEHDVKIDMPLGARYRRSKKVSAAIPGRQLRGVRPATTFITPLESRCEMTLCRVRMSSGLRHQVRAHLGHLGHPIAQDTLYGSRRKLPFLGDRFFLHAWKIRVQHPKKGMICEYKCCLTNELYETCVSLKMNVPVEISGRPE